MKFGIQEACTLPGEVLLQPGGSHSTGPSVAAGLDLDRRAVIWGASMDDKAELEALNSVTVPLGAKAINGGLTQLGGSLEECNRWQGNQSIV